MSAPPDVTFREAMQLVRYFGFSWALGPVELTEVDTPAGKEWKLRQVYDLFPPERRVTCTIRILG